MPLDQPQYIAEHKRPVVEAVVERCVDDQVEQGVCGIKEPDRGFTAKGSAATERSRRKMRTTLLGGKLPRIDKRKMNFDANARFAIFDGREMFVMLDRDIGGIAAGQGGESVGQKQSLCFDRLFARHEDIDVAERPERRVRPGMPGKERPFQCGVRKAGPLEHAVQT